MDALEVLKGARELLSENWTRGRLARDDGTYCAIGAISKVAIGKPRYLHEAAEEGGSDLTGFKGAVRTLGAVVPKLSVGPRSRSLEAAEARIVEFNDDQVEPDCVLAAFDAAIQKLES